MLTTFFVFCIHLCSLIENGDILSGSISLDCNWCSHCNFLSIIHRGSFRILQLTHLIFKTRAYFLNKKNRNSLHLSWQKITSCIFLIFLSQLNITVLEVNPDIEYFNLHFNSNRLSTSANTNIIIWLVSVPAESLNSFWGWYFP